MKTTNISFYFVLYIVAIVTVFVITMERDQLLKARDDDFSHLVELYVKPLKLTPSIDTVKVYVEANQPVTREPISLRTKVDGDVECVSFTCQSMEIKWFRNRRKPISGKV
jgi:hypothetical protein